MTILCAFSLVLYVFSMVIWVWGFTTTTMMNKKHRFARSVGGWCWVCSQVLSFSGGRNEKDKPFAFFLKFVTIFYILHLILVQSFSIIMYFIVLKFFVFSEFWIRGFTTMMTTTSTMDRKHLEISLLGFEFESGCAGALPSWATVRIHHRADFFWGVGSSTRHYVLLYDFWFLGRVVS
jgi:hypothetical protein